MPARSLRLLAPFGAALLAAGCGGAPAANLQPAGAPPTSASPSPAATQPAAAAGPVAPLTGLPTTAGIAGRAAVAVSVPIGAAELGRAVGLDTADLVYQEYETPARLRLLAVFQSHDAAEIGPVGQVRPADPALLPSLRPLYANSGGASGTEGLLAEAHITQVTSSSAPSAYRTGSVGLVTSTGGVLAAAPAGAKPPPPAVLPLAAGGDRFTTSRAGTARTVTVTAPGQAPETWTYAATTKRWNRAGTSVSVANLILQTAAYKEVRLRDPDRMAQSARVLGRGTCSAVSGGTVTPCSWYKRSPTAVTGYVDAASVPLRFATGPTWIALLPPGSKLAVG